MKKRAALLLLLPALGVMMAGCSPKETVKSVLRKGKEIVKTGINKTVEALDNFFADSNPENQKEEEKQEANNNAEAQTGEGAEQRAYLVELR